MAPGEVDRPRAGCSRGGAERLPLDGQHAVALEVAERAVVGEDVEAVVDPLERPARLVAAVGPVADVGPHDGHAVLDADIARTCVYDLLSGRWVYG